ncbi:MAG: vitamin K epoxide reductase family protein [Gemmatimonadetes bacterium]|nr:vitamin K epoxide reductase family protein [Gemmatimonadota bacterium]NNM04093.1 vitamin K epoxide reductase family protein [Gemmatimonadota bacterium]
MVLAILALSGLMVSLYMLAYAFGWVGQLICGVGNCEAVQSSPYSRMGPFPVAAFGVVGYLVLMTLSLAGLQPASRGSRLIPSALLGGGIIGVGFSAYLTYLEAFVIHAWCQWCVISAILMVLAFVAAIPELKRIGGSQ